MIEGEVKNQKIVHLKKRYFHLRTFFSLLSERGRGRGEGEKDRETEIERDRERRWYRRETPISFLFVHTNWVSNLQPGYVPWLGIEPTPQPFGLWYNAPTNWATLTRAGGRNCSRLKDSVETRKLSVIYDFWLYPGSKKKVTEDIIGKIREIWI